MNVPFATSVPFIIFDNSNEVHRAIFESDNLFYVEACLLNNYDPDTKECIFVDYHSPDSLCMDYTYNATIEYSQIVFLLTCLGEDCSVSYAY